MIALILAPKVESISSSSKSGKPCNFCGKTRREVKAMVEAGNNNQGATAGVRICDECVVQAATMIRLAGH